MGRAGPSRLPDSLWPCPIQVNQRNVPGIDSAYLAMDTEEGVEVVWNEVQFSERKNFKLQEEKVKAVFDNLIQLEHLNIVKFHKYWADVKENKARVIFITEYMSSGSLKQFLKKTKKNHKTMNEKGLWEMEGWHPEEPNQRILPRRPFVELGGGVLLWTLFAPRATG
uniref:Serine-threonine/tyrosine-protein kinase catalytic domain-containing protein n=1 Tax=Anolis carolinensis TaxID=28377 RepID=H9G3Y8_ANOCA